MKAAQDRQKSYVDRQRRDLKFQVGDQVFIKFQPIKGKVRFGQSGKLKPRFIGPFMILERVESVAYRLELPSELGQVHNVFHVSMLRKYHHDPSHVVNF